MALPLIEFDWDPAKAESNLVKHDVSFESAMSVLADPLALSRLDDDHGGLDERWLTIGCTRDMMLLVVVHTYSVLDDDTAYVRLISARKPTRNERRQYEQAPARN